MLSEARKTKLHQYSIIPRSTSQIMATCCLVMRNSHHEQAKTLHHSSLTKNSYAVPLYTISCEETDEQGRLDYVGKIKQFISKWAPFTENPAYPYPTYDYELVVAQAYTNPGVYDTDNTTSYPTGGKTELVINETNLKFSIYLTEHDVQFLHSILNGSHDHRILNPDIPVEKEIHLRQIRLDICHKLSSEIITARLIMGLNCLNKLKPASLDTVDLHILFHRVINTNHKRYNLMQRGLAKQSHLCDKFPQFLRDGKTRNSDHLPFPEYNQSPTDQDGVDDEIASVWAPEEPEAANATDRRPINHTSDEESGQHSEYALISQFFIMHGTLQNKFSNYWLIHMLFHSSHWDEHHARSLRSIFHHALNDRTPFGSRNKSFEACAALGWINRNGELAVEDKTIKRAFMDASRTVSA